MELNASTLNDLPPAVGRPRYDRRALTAGIIHFGVGGFHRSHQAMLLDCLMNQGEAFDWAVCGAGVLAADSPMAEALLKQEGLYTLVTKGGPGSWRPRVIGSIIDYCHALREPDRLLARLTAPAVRIVSLTITEGGYNLDDLTGEFRFDEPAVQRDLAGHWPAGTVFGWIAEACRQRRRRKLPGFTILSCDNLEGNGDTARKACLAFAARRDPAVAEWMTEHVSFPNSMVDRITPATTETDRAVIRDRFGIDDACPVVCEPFVQWVLEDRFPAGRPQWEKAGVQMVPDVAPYELMKLRLLNGGHQALAYLGYLHGYRYVHEAARDPELAEFVHGYLREEVTSTLLPVPGIDLDRYQRDLLERFGNPEIQDSLARICAYTSDRIPKWIIPVVRLRLEQGRSVARGAAIIASWWRFAQGVDESGRRFEVIDRRASELGELAIGSAECPLEFVRYRPVFGDLVEHGDFADAYLRAANLLKERGARATASSYRGAAR